jgi:membrane-associated protease RseP (regulator of RpoE activity)
VNWLTVIGILAFALGLMLSIALHEVGHLIPAKRFGIRVTQYMVGFGNTLWSTRRGETEYGIKAIPLGGYVRMIGMLPPEPGTDPRKLRSITTGPFQGMVEDARRAAKEEIQPGDEDRVFYRKPWWQKLIVMLGGPLMNVAIAIVLSAIVLMGFGIPNTDKLTPTVSSVSRCVKPADAADPTCAPEDPPTPAAAAGFRAGDVIVAFQGQRVESWGQISQAIRGSTGTVSVVVERDGKQLTLTPTLVQNNRYSVPGDPESPLVEVGFLGVSPTPVVERQGPLAVAKFVGNFTYRSAEAVLSIPEKMVDVWNAAFNGQERGLDSPVGIVGAGRIGGEIASADSTVSARVADFLLLLASFNMAIAIFNLIPLLPLDGGHAAGAIWEGIKRGWARVFKRPEPRPVDVARALPLAYGVASILIVMSVLLLYADIVNPVRLAG